jgi:hypothetical protein
VSKILDRLAQRCDLFGVLNGKRYMGVSLSKYHLLHIAEERGNFFESALKIPSTTVEWNLTVIPLFEM